MLLREHDRSVSQRRLPPGKAKQAFVGVRAEAASLGLDALVEICDFGLESVADYADLRARRAIQRAARAGGQARTLDAAVDTIVGDIVRALRRVPARYPDRPQLHEWAAILLEQYFPNGARPIVNLPYEEELLIVEYIHTHLGGAHREWCQALRIDRDLDDLAALLPRYREALSPREQISADDVMAAFQRYHLALMSAVAWVCGTFWREVDMPHRVRLLGPIYDQNDRMAELIQARRRRTNGATAGVTAGASVDEQALDPSLDEAGEVDALVAEAGVAGAEEVAEAGVAGAEEAAEPPGAAAPLDQDVSLDQSAEPAPADRARAPAGSTRADALGDGAEGPTP